MSTDKKKTNETTDKQTAPETRKKAVSTFYVPEYGVSVEATTSEEAVNKAKAIKRNKEDKK